MAKLNLQTPTSRARLAPRGKPYHVTLLPGVHLGYRRTRSTAGSWVVLAADGKGGRWTERFALADDKAPADGSEVLDYEQAALAAPERFAKRQIRLLHRGRRPYRAHLYGPAARCKLKVMIWRKLGLAHLYPALLWSLESPGHHGYPRALDLIRVSAPKAISAT
jgi:hypothetical protein